MRSNLRSSPGVSACFGVALAAALAAAATCEARDASLTAAEAGFPTYLINRPVCGTGETFDEWPLCPRINGSDRQRID
jgi:hypothetical protein